jgi:hypothetical protein
LTELGKELSLREELLSKREFKIQEKEKEKLTERDSNLQQTSTTTSSSEEKQQNEGKREKERGNLEMIQKNSPPPSPNFQKAIFIVIGFILAYLFNLLINMF